MASPGVRDQLRKERRSSQFDRIVRKERRTIQAAQSDAWVQQTSLKIRVKRLGAKSCNRRQTITRNCNIFLWNTLSHPVFERWALIRWLLAPSDYSHRVVAGIVQFRVSRVPVHSALVDKEVLVDSHGGWNKFPYFRHHFPTSYAFQRSRMQNIRRKDSFVWNSFQFYVFSKNRQQSLSLRRKKKISQNLPFSDDIFTCIYRENYLREKLQGSIYFLGRKNLCKKRGRLCCILLATLNANDVHLRILIKDRLSSVHTLHGSGSEDLLHNVGFVAQTIGRSDLVQFLSQRVWRLSAAGDL